MRDKITILRVLVVSFCICILTSCNDKKQKDSTTKSIVKSFSNKSQFAYLENINDPNYLVFLLDNSSNLEDAGIGIEGRRSQSYPIFKKLCEVASDTTLIRLTKHTNPKIRVYGMWALTEKNKQLALTQMRILKNDNANVIYTSGCISMPERVCWLIASKFDTTEVVLRPKLHTKYLDFDVVIK